MTVGPRVKPVISQSTPKSVNTCSSAAMISSLAFVCSWCGLPALNAVSGGRVYRPAPLLSSSWVGRVITGGSSGSGLATRALRGRRTGAAGSSASSASTDSANSSSSSDDRQRRRLGVGEVLGRVVGLAAPPSGGANRVSAGRSASSSETVPSGRRSRRTGRGSPRGRVGQRRRGEDQGAERAEQEQQRHGRVADRPRASGAATT